jgi:hypothetical protein
VSVHKTLERLQRIRAASRTKNKKKAAIASFKVMLLGLVRCAELCERDQGGALWDDESRVALDAARERGWGNDRIGRVS